MHGLPGPAFLELSDLADAECAASPTDAEWSNSHSPKHRLARSASTCSGLTCDPPFLKCSPHLNIWSSREVLGKKPLSFNHSMDQ